MERFNKPNENKILNPLGAQLEWVNKNTAILIVHGIGNQLPLETLDSFGRGLIKQYRHTFDEELTISHEIVTKPDDTGGVWFDNILRIHKEGSENYIDLYEYYWANYSQNKATWKDLNVWLQGVVKGATTFYRQNEVIGERYKDKSLFFDSKTGKFRSGKYWLFMAVISKLFLIVDLFWRLIIFLISLIPFLGKLADSLLQSYVNGALHDIVNIISEVAIYNVFDPKSKFYDVRRKILDGAVKAITFLIERPADKDFDLKGVVGKVKDKNLEKLNNQSKKLIDDLSGKLADQQLYYPSVIIAGHSLGTQVTYDALNKINLLINMGEIGNYDRNGICKFKNGNHIAEQLNGYITFGSPLDKVVFFLRENVPDNEYLRQQFLDNYHEFKLRDLDFTNNNRTNSDFLKASCNLKPQLKSVKWRNYYDHKDYVSGCLDYYTGLTNVDCHFKAGVFGFTHSYYWNCEGFYNDIILNFF
ncbi:MAG: hypothetical protein JWR12_620 [Mucilaginibacter sp.]|nr:hypothetical protein [Mucilaginibacter sp.]